MFEKQMRRKIHYSITPQFLWSNIYDLARTQHDDLLKTIQAGFKHIENDILGDAYEYLIGQFAAGSGKKAGEFYRDS